MPPDYHFWLFPAQFRAHFLPKHCQSHPQVVGNPLQITPESFLKKWLNRLFIRVCVCVCVCVQRTRKKKFTPCSVFCLFLETLWSVWDPMLRNRFRQLPRTCFYHSLTSFPTSKVEKIENKKFNHRAGCVWTFFPSTICMYVCMYVYSGLLVCVCRSSVDRSVCTPLHGNKWDCSYCLWIHGPCFFFSPPPQVFRLRVSKQWARHMSEIHQEFLTQILDLDETSRSITRCPSAKT